MPCYDPPNTPEQDAELRKRLSERGDYLGWYRMTPKHDLEQWLCDALRGNLVSPDCVVWWTVHKRLEREGKI